MPSFDDVPIKKGDEVVAQAMGMGTRVVFRCANSNCYAQLLFDAAEVDGCSILKQVWHVVVPLTKPIVGTLAVLRIIGEWNRFVGPLILIRDPRKQMLAVSLLHLEGEYTRNWGELMAGYTIASIPLIILFIFCMRLFVRGLSEGAIKG